MRTLMQRPWLASLMIGGCCTVFNGSKHSLDLYASTNNTPCEVLERNNRRWARAAFPCA